MAAGCAAVPVSGGVVSATIPPGPGSGTDSGQSCCGVIMNAPQPDWGPQQIVTGFLLASANFRDDHAAAREYLTAAASKAWRPGSAVTVVAQSPVVTLPQRPFRSQTEAVVQIQAQEVATLSGGGQYSPAPGGQQQLTWQFGVQLVNHQWRIATLPSSGVGQPSADDLLLTKDLFQLAYEPCNLYYFDPSGKVLVPDPVFVPRDSSDPATGLVEALLRSPAGWLAGAAFTAFPPKTRLRRPVQLLPGSTALVDLSLPLGGATEVGLRAVAAQLVWTLTSNSYSSSPAQSVQLEVNGRAVSPGGISIPVQDRRDYPQLVPAPPDHENLYYLAANGAARVLHESAPGGASPSGQALPGQAGTGQIPLHILAVSPADERYLAGIAGPSNTVYTVDLAAAAENRAKSSAGALSARLTGSGFTAISWDRRDDLWVAGKVNGHTGVWVVPPGAARPIQVSLPPGTAPITALRVARDGVRVAMIAGDGRLLLGAIIRSGGKISIMQNVAVGTDVTDPTALSWYDADHLLVVAQSTAGPTLDEVPVDGDTSTAIGVQSNMVSIAAAGSFNPLYAGLQTNHLARSIGFSGLWSLFVPGSSATYPG